MVNDQTVGMSTAIEYTWGLGVICRVLWVSARVFPHERVVGDRDRAFDAGCEL